MDKNCPMRHENGNCLPAGGFCTANKNICEALLNAYGMGKAQLSQEGTTKDATSDTISRQAAIDAIVGCTTIKSEEGLREYVEEHLLKNRWSGGILAAINAVKDLPFVQPEIIRCKDCKEFRRWIDTDIEFCDRTENRVSEYDFCSHAERRTGK